MSIFDALRHRWYVLKRGESYIKEVERELRFPAELDRLSHTPDGREAFDAEMRARRAAGATTYHREEVRSVTMLSWLDGVRQDLGYAWRGIRREPGFALTVIVTIGLGL